MFILKEKLAGYNNILTLATKKMKFGVNRKVNYNSQAIPKKVENQETQAIPKKVQVTQQSQQRNVASENNELGYVFGSIFLTGLIALKYIFQVTFL